MEVVSKRRPQKFGECGICGARCYTDWIETVNGVEWVSPRCLLHKPNTIARKTDAVKRYEDSHHVNERVYSFTDKEGNVVTCKKAWWYRAKKAGKFAQEQPAA